LGKFIVHLHPSNFILHPCPLIPACGGNDKRYALSVCPRLDTGNRNEFCLPHGIAYTIDRFLGGILMYFSYRNECRKILCSISPFVIKGSMGNSLSIEEKLR
jgi:hypothetical protein